MDKPLGSLKNRRWVALEKWLSLWYCPDKVWLQKIGKELICPEDLRNMRITWIKHTACPFWKDLPLLKTGEPLAQVYHMGKFSLPFVVAHWGQTLLDSFLQTGLFLVEKGILASFNYPILPLFAILTWTHSSCNRGGTMGARLHSWWQQIKIHPVATALIALFVALRVLVIFGGYKYDNKTSRKRHRALRSMGKHL